MNGFEYLHTTDEKHSLAASKPTSEQTPVHASPSPQTIVSSLSIARKEMPPAEFRGNGHAAALLQLQRSHGNAYVQGLIARKGTGTPNVQPEVEQEIHASRGQGQPLDSGVRRQMESGMSADFSNVRVHTDSKADAMSQSLGAKAFTTGSDVYFRQNAYNPGSSSGRELIAHELTHVVQQSGSTVQTKLTVNEPGDRYEQEADRVAHAVVHQENQPTPVQRADDDDKVQAKLDPVQRAEDDDKAQMKMEDMGIQREGDDDQE